ncbi:aminotransferase class IV [Maricaulaceae bacterium MS644]
MSRVWLNGAFADAGEAGIAPSDRSFLLGDGAFETLRFEHGAILRWARHRARLEGALSWLEIAAPDFAAIEAAAVRLCGQEGLADAVLRLTVSRGSHGAGPDAPSGEAGTVLLTARPLPVPRDSVSLMVAKGARRAGLQSERHKLTSYAEPLAARREAKRAGADMALMVSAVDGAVVCADCANVFAVLDGLVVTPPVSAGALPGTARAALLEAWMQQGAPIVERALAQADIARAEAVFVTNAVSGVVAAGRLDGRALDARHPMVLAARALEASAR